MRYGLRRRRREVARSSSAATEREAACVVVNLVEKSSDRSIQYRYSSHHRSVRIRVRELTPNQGPETPENPMLALQGHSYPASAIEPAVRAVAWSCRSTSGRNLARFGVGPGLTKGVRGGSPGR